jgi:hypothetical protein
MMAGEIRIILVDHLALVESKLTLGRLLVTQLAKKMTVARHV